MDVRPDNEQLTAVSNHLREDPTAFGTFCRDSGAGKACHFQDVTNAEKTTGACSAGAVTGRSSTRRIWREDIGAGC